MYDITTGTGDFIANGVVSHNCFARNTHEYLELDTGRDFDTQIVVKINVVDVLRRELARPSWTREHVAMGTNTDPYQRAEGRYRLMPGIIARARRLRHPVLDPHQGHAVLRDLAAAAAAAARRSRSASASRWRLGRGAARTPSSRAPRRRGRGSTWSGRSPTPGCRAGCSWRRSCPG